MTLPAINALFRYFETLFIMNQNLLALCGSNVFYQMQEQEKLIDDVIINIPRLIPYGYNTKDQLYEIKKSDGLMKFADNFPFLSVEYEKILQDHNDLLIKVVRIRNKLVHEIHNARIVASGSSPSFLFSFTYEVNESEINIYSSELIAFAKDLNTLFSKIQENIKLFAYDHNCISQHFYWRLTTRYSFSEFNLIYESDLLHIVGKAMLPF
jgi:hypothetical protein